MHNYLILLICFISSLLLTFLVRKWALNRAILDLPNERSSHTIPTPRGGGLAFSAVWFLFLIYAYFNGMVEKELFLALLSGLLLVSIGFVDDIISLKPSVRIIFQLFACGSALFFLKGLSVIDLGFGSLNLSLNLFLNLLVLMGMVWMVNLYNFLDGIDGYAATEAIFVFGAISLFLGDVLALVMVITVLGFLVWNWQPAKIFMGDVGSTLLGFNIAVFAIYYQNTLRFPIIAALMLTSAFWFDATLTLYRRWRNREQLSKAHRKHAYQRIVQSGWSHQRTVLSVLAINILILGFVWLTVKFPLLTLPLFGVTIIILYLIMRVVDKRKSF